MPTAPKSDASPTSRVVPVEGRDSARVRPDLFACVELGRKGRDQAGLEEAAQQFEGDLRAELAAIEAGTHPLQQGRSASQ